MVFTHIPAVRPYGFYYFWGSQHNTSMFDPSIFNGGTVAGGHAVLIVGYDTTDPSNPYWIVLNSWGAPSNRPDGLFRLNMTMNYNAKVGSYYQNWFQIVNSGFTNPTVTGVSPGSGTTDGGASVIITGTGFTGANTVKFGSTANTTGAMTINSDTRITVTSPAYAAGIVDITVTNMTSGTSPTSANDKFTYIIIPTVTGIHPTYGLNTSPVSITNLAGTNFYGVPTVVLNRTGSSDILATDVTVVSPSRITCTFPITHIPAGIYNVTVINPDGQQARLTNGFTVMGPPLTQIGVFRSSHGWFLDSSGNGVWNSGSDTAYGFGMIGDVPVTGDWNHAGKTMIGVFRGRSWLVSGQFRERGMERG